MQCKNTLPEMAFTNRSKQQNFFLILILGALHAITPFSIDMYLPAFPKIAADFKTTIENVALSVSTYFLGFALGQILYGPLLDRFGRKPPLYAGLTLYILATIGCFNTGTIESLWAMRFIQALGGCVASVAAMAMVRDFFPVEKSAAVISLLVLILGASPLLAPTIGSFVIDWWGWHFVFVILAVITFLVLLCVIFFLPEGHMPDKNISLKPAPIIKGFIEVLSNPKFYVFALAGSFSFSGLFSYVAHSPAIFMDHFHLSGKVYGGVFALLSVGFIGSSQLNHLLVKKYKNEQILTSAIIIQLMAAAVFTIGAWQQWYGLIAVILFLFIILSCAGVVYPNAAAICMAPFEKNAGSASALLGFGQIGVGALVSGGAGMLPFNPVLSMALATFITVIIAVGILLLGKKKQPVV